MKVMIIHSKIFDNAPPDEQDVMVQAVWIAGILEALGVDVHVSPFDEDIGRIQRYFLSEKPDCVFNLVETVKETGRYAYLLPAVCEIEGIPYTGSGPEVILITSNKLVTKRILASEGIPVAPNLWPLIMAVRDVKFPQKIIVKPVWEDGSVGLSTQSVVEVEEIHEAVEAVRHVGNQIKGEVFAEQYIEGREFNVSLLARGLSVQVLPVSEIIFSGYERGELQILDYSAKWCPDASSYERTVRSFGLEDKEGELASLLSQIAVMCWNILGLRGYARVDFRVDEDGNPWILEVNANPCLAPDAGFMAAAYCAGLAERDVVLRILEDAVMRR